MFQISNISSDAAKFILGLNSQGLSRAKPASVSLAKAIANSLSIPSGIVEDFKDFYNTNYRLKVLGLISTINEMTIVDVPAIEDYTVRFLEAKYNVAYARHQTLAMKKECAVEDFFGISKSIPCDIIEVIKADPANLTYMVNGFAEVINSLNKQD